MTEPKIIINEIVLNDAQSMTIRVALNNFSLDLTSDGLGEDDHGKQMTKLYLKRISEVNCIIGK